MKWGKVLAWRDQQINTAFDTEARYDRVFALAVSVGLSKNHGLTALFIVVGNLQKRRALSRVHRTVSEVKFRHLIAS
jgi:hypothetical protein